LVEHEELCAAVLETASFPAVVVGLNGHGTELFQRLEVALELLKMFAYDPRVIGFLDHVDVAEVLCVLLLMLTANLNSFIDAVTSTIECCAL